MALLPDTVRVRMPAIELQLTVLSRFLEDLVLHQQTRVDPLLIDAFELDSRLRRAMRLEQRRTGETGSWLSSMWTLWPESPIRIERPDAGLT